MPKDTKKIETTLFFGSLNVLHFYRHDLLFSYPLCNVHYRQTTQPQYTIDDQTCIHCINQLL